MNATSRQSQIADAVAEICSQSRDVTANALASYFEFSTRNARAWLTRLTAAGVITSIFRDKHGVHYRLGAS